MKMIKSTVLILALSLSATSAADLLATVNGKKLTVDDANRFLQTVNSKYTFDKLPAEDKKIIVERIVDRVLYVDLAKESNISSNPEYIAQLEALKNELLVNKWMEKKFVDTSVSDEEAKKYYEDNKDKFKSGEKVRARHILFKEDEAAAKDTIAQLKDLSGDKLKEKFIELAKSKSEGPTKSKGGDLGFFGRKRMVPEFDKVAFELKVGEITTEPVKTQFGYHVIYLEERKESGSTEYKKVEQQIKRKLKQEKFKKALDKSTEKVRKDAKILLEEIKEDPKEDTKK